MQSLKKLTQKSLVRQVIAGFAIPKFAPYNFEDPLNFVSLLTEEEKMVNLMIILINS